MTEYLLRKIDDGLWTRVKRRAAREGVDGVALRTVILNLLEQYAAGRIELAVRGGRHQPVQP